VNRTTTVTAYLGKGVKFVLPAPAYWRALAWKIGNFDPEVRLLPYLCDKTRVSIDVGASGGAYTVHMLIHSSKCYAFEPRRTGAALIVQRLGSTPRLRVETVALSDRSGSAQLKILTGDKGRSSIERTNPVEQLGEVERVTVPMRRLDDYDDIGTVGCIKIDVEGHEEAVLRGARQMLLRDHPSLIVEIEERHKRNSVGAVRNFLGELGYAGFFFRRERLSSIEAFRVEEHQDVSNIEGDNADREKYVNNFVFIASRSLAKVQHLIARPS
jgi:FkbM family methyltransferase